MSAPPHSRLRLLGVARAEHAGAELRFPDRKCIALLTVLALDGPCTRARMAAMLWDEQNDADARRNLRRELHRLREGGFDPLLAAEGDQLRLHEGVDIDATAFAQALSVAEPATLGSVLAAYGGELLAGFDLAGAPAFNDWLAARRDGLAQRWRAAAEAHCGTLQTAGDLRGALQLATELLHHDTLQEGHYRRAMMLHAALGEREAALALYERCRRQLGKELGLKPLMPTVALADQIRNGEFDTAPAAPAPAAPSPPPVPALQTLPEAPLVGRAPLLAALQQALARRPLVVLRGEAGLGKSCLLQALAAATPGARIHSTRASDRRVPFAALVRWLRGAAPLQDTPPWVQAELARLMPEWGAAPPPSGSDAERLRLYEAVGVAWAARFGGASLNLFDDWHFVDEASALWWGWWQGQDGVPLLVAERPGQATGETAAVLADALAASGGRPHELPPLDDAALFQLVQVLSGTEQPQRFAQRLWLATGGHPLYALQTLQHLLQTDVIRIDEHGQWRTPFDDATADYRELPIAPSVQAALLQRVDSLAEAPRRLIEAASLAGDEISLPLTAAACALDEWDAVQALEAALQARVLLRHEDRPDTYRFAHDLFAQTVAAGLSPERRRLLHRAIGQRLAQEGAAPARVADHLEQAAHNPAERAQACEWRLRALAAARQRMALGDVLLQAERVLALSPPPEAAVRAHLGRSSALLARSLGEDAARALAEAAALLQADTDIELHVAVLAMRASQSLQGQGEGHAAALAALDAVLHDTRLSRHQRGRLLKCRSDTLRVLGQVEPASQALDEALAAFGDEPSVERGNVLDGRARIAMNKGDFATVLEQARLGVAVMQEAGHPEAAAAPLTMCGVALMCQGHLPEALAELQAARALAHHHGLVSAERGAILNLVPALLALGRGAEALACLEEGYALSPSFRGPAEQHAFLEARYQCRVDLGDLGGALTVRPELLAFSARLGEAPRRHSGQLVALDLPLLLDDLALAAPLVDELLADMAKSEPHYLNGQALAKAAWLARLQGQPSLALAHSRQALALPGQRPETAAMRCVMHAAALLANGEPAAARQALDVPFDGAGAEVRALCLATALQVQLGSGGVEAGLQQQVLDQLAGDALPPLIELHLLDALAALPDGLSAAQSGRAGTLAARLQTSLDGHPQAQAGFRRRFGRWAAAAAAAGA